MSRLTTKNMWTRFCYGWFTLARAMNFNKWAELNGYTETPRGWFK